MTSTVKIKKSTSEKLKEISNKLGKTEDEIIVEALNIYNKFIFDYNDKYNLNGDKILEILQ